MKSRPGDLGSITAINQGLEDDSFNLWHSDWSLGVGGASSSTLVSLNDWNRALQLPGDGTVSVGIVSGGTPESWVRGKLRYSLFYTGNVSSTNTIRWSNRLSVIKVGGATGGPATKIEEAYDLAGPATAGDLLSYDNLTELSVEADHVLWSLVLRRNDAHANDTYTGNVHVLAALIQYYPDDREE